MSSGEQRWAVLRQAEERLLDQRVIIALYFDVSRALVRPGVRRFEDKAMDIHLSRWLWLE